MHAPLNMHTRTLIPPIYRDGTSRHSSASIITNDKYNFFLPISFFLLFSWNFFLNCESFVEKNRVFYCMYHSSDRKQRLYRLSLHFFFSPFLSLSLSLSMSLYFFLPFSVFLFLYKRNEIMVHTLFVYFLRDGVYSIMDLYFYLAVYEEFILETIGGPRNADGTKWSEF